MLYFETIFEPNFNILQNVNERRVKIFGSSFDFTEFCITWGSLKTFYRGLKKSVKFSATNPTNFVEIWSFTSTRIRVISLIIILLAVVGLVPLYFFGGSSSYIEKNDVPIERQDLLAQNIEVKKKIGRLEREIRYYETLKKILLGEVPINSNIDSLAKITEVVDEKLDLKMSAAEKKMAAKVRDDLRTKKDNGAVIPYFKSPVNGIVSQGFSKKNHPGIDVVTEKDHTVKACLSGTVIYSGYTRKDGYILILDHSNEYMTVYKHNKKALKKMGDKVQLGDPIAIVGNTGENTDGASFAF